MARHPREPLQQWLLFEDDAPAVYCEVQMTAARDDPARREAGLCPPPSEVFCGSRGWVVTHTEVRGAWAGVIRSDLGVV